MRLSWSGTTKAPYNGPWELFEVLYDEFRQIDPALSVDFSAVWRVRPDDIVDEQTVKLRIEELELISRWPQPRSTYFTNLVVRARDLALRLVRPLMMTRGAVHVFASPVVPTPDGVFVPPLPSDSAAAILDRALDLDPADLVEICWRYLSADRGRALRENIPNLAALDRPEPVRQRFNRQVLEIAFNGLLRPAAHRAAADLYRAADLREKARTDAGHPRTRWALCLSGGGIRSASFSLGVIQGLARQRILRRVDYLSTVSGGGYIGSWLSAWMARSGRDAVLAALDEPKPGDDPARRAPKSPLDPEPSAIRHLRAFSNYLAPKKGLLAADVWTLGATVARNLLLNWLVVLPVLAAGLLLPLVAASIVANPPSSGLFAWIAGLTLVGFAGAVMGVYFVHTRRPDGNDEVLSCNAPSPEAEAARRVRKARGERAFLARCLLPIVVGAAALTTAWSWLNHAYRTGEALPRLFTAAFPLERAWLLLVVFGVVAHVTGWLLAQAALQSSGTSSRAERARELVAIVGTGAVVGLGISFLCGWIVTGSTWLASVAGDRLAMLIAAISGVPLDSVTTGPEFSLYPQTAVYAMLALPAFITSLVIAGFLYVGLTSRDRFDEEREWSARYSAWLLLVAGGWLALSSISVLGGWILGTIPRLLLGAGIGGGTGWIAALIGKSAHTADENKPSPPPMETLLTVLSKFALALAAPLGVVLMLMSLAATAAHVAVAANAWLAARRLDLDPQWVLVALLVIFAAAGAVFSYYIDVNKFSLHAMYRARLIRAYLGASRRAGTRVPNPFTGFDSADNMAMHCLCDSVPTDLEKPPIHVLNLALNLTAVNNLEWQDRKARSFTVSQYHAGAWGLGYRRTRLGTDGQADDYYGGREQGISLGTAMAISGAAASPNMGYHSSPAITFLMALFNARLGWWLGNPGWAGRKTFNSANPRRLISPIFAELLGLTTDSEPLVYLSDGGHFENLALYEMVVRRCRLIIAVDASCDVHCTFDDLGNAIRKIRVDLGVPVVFDTDPFDIKGRGEDGGIHTDGSHVAFGRVMYSAVDPLAEDGHIIYLKPALTGDEPRDVLAYAEASKSFPHESTSDQFFSELQLESYRALGEHSVSKVINAFRPLGAVPGPEEPAASVQAASAKYSAMLGVSQPV